MTARTATKAALGPCGRCWKRTPAVTVETLTFGSSSYEVPLCDEHADNFLTDMFAWARCGRIVDDHVTFAPPPAREDDDLGPVAASYVHVPTVVEEPEPEAVPAPRAEPKFDTSPLINADRWTWSDHAIERATLRQLTEDEVLWAAEHPDRTRPGHGPTERIHHRGYVKVTVDVETCRIITVADTRYEDNERELLDAS